MSKRETVFWSIFVLCVSFVIVFSSREGCNYCNEKRGKRTEAYKKCIEKSKDVRECRDILNHNEWGEN